MRSSFETEWKKMYSAKVLIVFTQTIDDTGKKRGNITSFSIHEDQKIHLCEFSFFRRIIYLFFHRIFFCLQGEKKIRIFFFFFYQF